MPHTCGSDPAEPSSWPEFAPDGHLLQRLPTQFLQGSEGDLLAFGIPGFRSNLLERIPQLLRVVR